MEKLNAELLKLETDILSAILGKTHLSENSTRTKLNECKFNYANGEEEMTYAKFQQGKDVITKEIEHVRQSVTDLLKKKTDCKRGLITFLKSCQEPTRTIQPIIVHLNETLDFLLESSPDHISYLLYDMSESEQYLEIKRFLRQEYDELECASGESVMRPMDKAPLVAARRQLNSMMGAPPSKKKTNAAAKHMHSAMSEMSSTAHQMFEDLRKNTILISDDDGESIYKHELLIIYTFSFITVLYICVLS